MKKTKKGRKLQENYAAARKALYDSYGGVTKKKFKDLDASHLNHGRQEEYKSIQSADPAVCGRTNMMEPMVLRQESEEVQAAILRKASRLVPQYNKGAVQYTPDEQDPSDLGRKK